MNGNERNNEYEDFLKLFEENRSSGSEESEDSPAICRKQQQRSLSQQISPRPGKVRTQSHLYLSAHPAPQNSDSERPEEYPSFKREAQIKRRQRRRIIISVITVVVLILVILLIVRLRGGGGDVLKGTWDYDGVTVYQFDGEGKGSLNLPSSTYPFTYVIKGNEVCIDFESESARDSTYTFTVEKEKLILVRTEENQEKSYELLKVDQRPQ